MNQFPNVERFVRNSSEATPDTTDVFLKVKKPARTHFGLEYDNLGNELTGQNHAAVVINVTARSKEGDSLRPVLLNVFPSGNSIPLRPGGLHMADNFGSSLSLTFSSADLLVGGQFAILNLQGNIAQYGLQLTHLSGTRADANPGSFGYDTKSFSNFALNNQAQQDNIRDLRVGYLFIGTRCETASNSLLVSLRRDSGRFRGTALGIPGQPSRASDVPTKFDATYVRVQPIGKPTSVPLTGQAAIQPLLWEQFSGGIDSGSGFIQSEVLADEGYAASAELHVPLDKKGRTGSHLSGLWQRLRTESAAAPDCGPKIHRAGGIRTILGKSSYLRDVGYPLDP